MKLNIDIKQNTTAVRDKQTPSPAIWADCPVNLILEQPRLGRYLYEDWKQFPLIGIQTTEIAHGGWKVFNTGAGTVVPVSAVNSVEIPGGALKIALDTDNDQGAIAQSYPTFNMTGDPATSGKLWFEVCYAQKSVLTNMAAVMIGLAETELWTLATAVPFNAGDAITNAASFIGFRIEEDGLGVIDTVYSDRATSFTNIGDTEGGTLTAFTFKKLGIVYDPAKAADCVTFYADNLELTTRLSKAALVALTNLDANALGPIIAACADSAGTAFEAYIKWIRVCQLNPGEAA